MVTFIDPLKLPVWEARSQTTDLPKQSPVARGLSDRGQVSHGKAAGPHLLVLDPIRCSGEVGSHWAKKY